MRSSIILYFTKHYQDDEIKMDEMDRLFEGKISLGRYRRS
jgi:hypothetical protein